MKFYNCDVVKGKILDGLVQIVTPNIRKCYIGCYIEYSHATNRYSLVIRTSSAHHSNSESRLINLGKQKVMWVVKTILSNETGSKIIVYYNEFVPYKFIDRSKA